MGKGMEGGVALAPAELRAPPALRTRSRGEASAQALTRTAPVEPSAKRKRVSAKSRPKSDSVLLVAFDAPLQPVDASRALLADFKTRLHRVVAHDPPTAEVGGRPAWDAGPSLPRAVLVSLLRSLAVGELLPSKEVTPSELLAALDYEGVSVRELGAVPKVRGVAPLEPPPRALAGMLSRPSGLTMHADVESLSEQIALALAHWPRLAHGLTAAAEGRGAGGFDCSATRVWIQFAESPLQTPRAEPSAGASRGTQAVEAASAASNIETLARRWPRWLSALVITLELLHARRVRDSNLLAGEFAESMFREVQRDFEGDVLGRFAMHRFDSPAAYDVGKSGAAFRREIHDARVAAHRLRTLAMEPLPSETSDGALGQRTMWARAAVAFAEATVSKTPNLAALFGEAFVDDAGQSFERAALAKALRRAGLKLVRWAASAELAGVAQPLVFPSSFQSGGRREGRHNGPLALIAVEPRA
jgi:hypothetical protein